MTIAQWWDKERGYMQPISGSLLLGGICYGPTFFHLFSRYSLPSMLAKANYEALQHAVIVLYTDESTQWALEALARESPLRMIVRVMPPEVMAGDFWPRLSAAQGLLCVLAARSNMPFHMLMPDQVYCEDYFRPLMAMGEKYRRIAHNGLNVHYDVSATLRTYIYGGALSISPRALTDLSWPNLHYRMSPFVFNACTTLAEQGIRLDPERMPNCHYQVWRARERVMIFSPHNNTAYMDAATCRQLDLDAPPVNSLDAIVQTLFGHEYYIPRLQDDMAFIGLEYSSPDAHPQNGFHIPLTQFIERCREETHRNAAYLDCFSRASEMPASVDEGCPLASDVMATQQALVHQMRDGP